ncbi:MAG: TRAFs-binding domain-containing protein [Rhizomicrobium sp.]
MPPAHSPSLLSIIAYARSGALDYACRLFLEGGFELVDDDPAVLSVRGRLLKDRALAAEGAERRRLYLEAAGAYARAGEIGGATYPLINAATLSLLAGRREQSQALAGKLLERALAGGDELETPYYRAATHAEALLLLGEIAKAKTALAKAFALAPKAYEDHASTLRQFGLILTELGKDTAWLDPLRPPRTLHFAGHMGVAIGGKALKRRLRAFIAKERIGFGYGALAAGADILVAEALLEEGAELHLVLPMPKERFRALSVAGFGDGWTNKFDRILARAASVRAIAGAPDPLFPHAIQLGAEIAMGCAVMQAGALMTEAVQLVVFDKARGGVTGWIGALWKKSGRRQRALGAPRVRPRPATPRALPNAAPVRLAAMLRIDLAGIDANHLTNDILPRLAIALAKAPKPLFPPRWTGEALLTAFGATAPAARAAIAAAAALADSNGVRIAGHYASVQQARDAFSRKPFLVGTATHLLAQVVRSTPSGAVHLTEDFAAALHAGPARGRPRTEYVGDLPAEDGEDSLRLFSLKR